MKAKTRAKIILLIIALTAVCLFAGCKIGEQTAQSFLKDKNAENQVVTYYANGGTFNGTGNLVTKDMYYPAGAEIILDFDAVANISVARQNYVFDGWYYALLEEGKPVFEEGSTTVVKSSGEKVDTSKPVYINENEHLYLCAHWVLGVQLEYILVTDDNQPVQTADGEVQVGGVIRARNFNSSSSLMVDNSDMPASTSHTFIGNYSDPECTQPFTGYVSRPAEGEGNAKVYSKYIKGDFEVVRTAADVAAMFAGLYGGNNYYIANDIDCGNRLMSLTNADMNSAIYGNGHKISNLTVQGTGYTGDTLSLFGSLTDKALIKDLTMESVSVTVTVRPGASIGLYLLVSDAHASAIIENVNIKAFTLLVNKPENATITNIQQIGTQFETDNWLCGGMTDDAEFFAKYTTFKVSASGEVKVGQNTVAVLEANHNL